MKYLTVYIFKRNGDAQTFYVIYYQTKETLDLLLIYPSRGYIYSYSFTFEKVIKKKKENIGCGPNFRKNGG